MNVEIVVPVRPGQHDQFPVIDGLSGGCTDLDIFQNEIECPDGNLSQVYKDAYLASDADVVIFKHDDFHIRNWFNFSLQMLSLMRGPDGYPVVGVAGARSYAPERHVAWWMQSAVREGMVDGINRGYVAHPAKYGPLYHNLGIGEVFTDFGPPGPAVVLDGCCFAVVRQDDWFDCCKYAKLTHQGVADCFDPEFKNHFYDIAFSLNLSRMFFNHGKVAHAPIYIVHADVVHQSPGPVGKAWEAAGAIFKEKYRRGVPISTDLFSAGS